MRSHNLFSYTIPNGVAIHSLRSIGLGHKLYRHVKFHQNPQVSSKFLTDIFRTVSKFLNSVQHWLKHAWSKYFALLIKKLLKKNVIALLIKKETAWPIASQN